MLIQNVFGEHFSCSQLFLIGFFEEKIEKYFIGLTRVFQTRHRGHDQKNVTNRTSEVCSKSTDSFIFKNYKK